MEQLLLTTMTPWEIERRLSLQALNDLSEKSTWQRTLANKLSVCLALVTLPSNKQN